MNILFFYESMCLGGQQTYNYNLVRRMAAKGHKMHYSYLMGGVMQDKIGSVAELQHIPIKLEGRDYLYKPWRLLSIFYHLRRYCKTNKIEVIISASGIGSLLAGLVARSLGVPHFRLLGCSLIQVEKTLYSLYDKIGIDKLIDGYFGWPAVFAELSAKGVNTDKFHEIVLAVDSNTFRPLNEMQRQTKRTALGIQDSELVIGWVGRISEDMQVGNTVKLGKALIEKGFTDFRLLLVGGGSWLEGLQDLVAEYQMADKVIFTDWVPMDSVNEFINAMDIVPLLEPDPQGGSIMRESIAAGCVTISVDGPCQMQRQFMLPQHSILVTPDNFIEEAANALLSLQSNPDKIIAMKAKAREYAINNLSFEPQVDAILETVNS